MKRRAGLVLAAIFAALAVGCGQAASKTSAESAAPGAYQNEEFRTLFAENCAACHGEHGKGGAANALDDAVYLAIADDAVIRNAIINGGPGTASPAFGQTAGGLLKDEQIATLVKGIRAWARPEELNGVQSPRYAAERTGDTAHGGKDFQIFCAACHGADGTGTKFAGSIVNPSFLALVSDEALRTIVIVGRPELGAPDWRNDAAGQPMSDEQITDVVAWLATHRVPYPGQPYPSGTAASGAGERK
ncbi:MAG TPA: cytochrome c [Candidatus Acidoferrales bacterium]|jgi:mono/diheme cytochrome c family protein|nr:cytochrome c [Candidatus Acidoferrales bacterium]